MKNSASAGESTQRNVTQPAATPPRSPRLALLVFVVGTGSLGAEIAAVRLLAPYFGASTVVWANTIGIILVALSIGYWLGGRWADRHPDPEGPFKLALVAALLLAAVPFAAKPFLDIAVAALDSVSAGAFAGSLVGVLFLVAVPVLLLGAVSPWALRLAMVDLEQAGSVAGRLYAVSTAGSLAGTLLAALVLIPLAGTRRTFLIFAMAIALTALTGLRHRARKAVAPLIIAALFALPPAPLKEGSETGRSVIYETETEYQYARVIEADDGTRTLELNEGQAIHSQYRPNSVLTTDYWDAQLVLPWAGGRTRPPRRVAILGNAGGTTARAYGALFPATYVDGVEIDGELSEIGRRYFHMSAPRLQVHTQDARPYLRRTRRTYDVILLDAYRQPYVPFYLATREFFELARSRMAPRGTLVVNVGHPAGEVELERVLSATLGEVFPSLARYPATSTNTLLVAGDETISASRLRDAKPWLPPELAETVDEAVRGLTAPLPAGDVYTDDDAPVEWLIDQSLVKYAAGR